MKLGLTDIASFDIAARFSRAQLALALAAALVAVAPARSSAQCPDFSATLVFPTGVSSTSLAVADFNQDGATDLAVANSGSNSLGILLGHGNGSFEPHVEHPTPTPPRAVAAGDFDGDGIADLASTRDGNSMDIRLGVGDGSFAPATTYASGGSDIAVGDLNGDGHLDLVLSVSSVFTVWLGVGDGTFAGRIDRAMNANFHVALGDLDGDDVLDLLITGTYSGHQGYLKTLLGNGDGTFGSENTRVTSFAPGRPAVGDLNGDGKLDVAQPANQVLTSFLGQGDGTLVFASNENVASLPIQTAVLQDFDGDGRLDAVAGALGLVGVLHGLENGNFDPVASRPAGNVEAMALADLDRDGISDVVWTNTENAASVQAMRGRGDGTFHYGEQQPANLAEQYSSVRTADLDLDGDLDLTLTRWNGGLYGSLGASNGTFGPLQELAAGSHYASTHATGDLNSDGRPDAVLCKDAYPSSKVTVLLGQAGPTLFAAGTDYPLVNSPAHVAIGDLNLDGKSDLAVATPDVNVQSPHTMQILLGNGDGTFVSGAAFRAGKSPYDVVIADMNGDAKPDLVVPDADSSGFSVFLGQGDGTFPTRTRTFSQVSPVALAVADLDADGALDVVVANRNTQWVSVHLGLGNATFTPTFLGTMAGPRDVAIGDLNADGFLDLAITCVPGIQLFEGRGDGTFANRHHAIGAPGLDEALLAHLDGDGAIDVAAVSTVLSIYRRFECSAVDVPAPDAGVATHLALRAFPNPARSALTIQLVAPRPLTVDAEVFDPNGRSIRTIAAGNALGAGTHRLVWDGTSRFGARMPNGVYFVRIRGGGEVKVERVVLLRP